MSKYHKGDKFIVEIKEVMNSDNGTLYRSDFKTLTFDDNGLDKLQKCETELSWDECYNKGLNDAWELAKKITIMSCNDREEIFEVSFSCEVFRQYTPQETLAKLEAYEKKQAEAKVGDEITVVGNAIKGYVIDESKECEDCYVVLITNYKDLHTAIYNKSVIQKTGKHIDIQSVLSQIAE